MCCCADMTRLLLVMLLLASSLAATLAGCPTWTYCDETHCDETHCQCGGNVEGEVFCDQGTLRIMVEQCFCLTFSAVHNTTVLGKCSYNCYLYTSWNYYPVPKNISALNEGTCGLYNRRGQQCSHCREGYGLSAYSYNRYCTECTEYEYNWVRYLLEAYLPVTLFYVATLCFKNSITKSSIYGYVLVSQLMTTTNCVSLEVDRRFRNTSQWNILPHEMFFAIHSIWNLDFGRSLYEPFCLHPDLTMHQVLALDYLIAVYPLLLILLTYLLVKLHDSYRLAVIICKPFYCCIRCIRKEWNANASLIDVFATFILLSNVKLLNVSFDLISVPVSLRDMHENFIPSTYTYLNGSVEYLGKEHLPYFLLGVAVILVFNVLLILLLCLYPFRCFQRCLNCCSLSSPSLHIFMDAFQGCYKTTPHDYRRMAILPLITMLLNFIAFLFTQNESYFFQLGYILSVMSFIILACRPYKRGSYNFLHALVYLSASLASFSQASKKIPRSKLHLFYYTRYILNRGERAIALLPAVFILSFLGYRVFKAAKEHFCRNAVRLNDVIEEECLLN